MDARQVDEAAKRLRGLRAQTVEDLVLAAAAVTFALIASHYRPALAMPLLVGAFGVAFLGMRALVRRTFLVEDLAVDRDAFVIPDVRRFALRAASPDHRRQLACSLRGMLTRSPTDVAARLACVRGELEEIIAALEDDRLRWKPQAAVTLDRWLNDPSGSLRDQSAPVAELRTRLRSLLAGLEDRDRAG